MFTGFILSLREGLEAALLIAIIFSILTKKDENGLKKWIWLGSAAGIAASLATAIVLTLIRVSLTGTAEVLFEGFSLLLAAVILTWVIFWMRGESRKQTTRLITKVESASNKFTLFGLAFLVVIREGIELSLFLLAAGTLANPFLTLLSALTGLAVAVLLGWLWMRSTRRVSLQKFFALTNILLVIFAAGLLSRAAHEFIEVGWLPALVEPLYDISRVIPANGALGEFLGSLVGFNPTPALTESLVYVFYLIGIITISFTIHSKQREN